MITLKHLLQKAFMPSNVGPCSAHAYEPDMMIEYTPNNKAVFINCETGKKLDRGKPQMWLVPLDAVKAVAELMTKALEKYPDKDNWRKIVNGEERYINALLRHLEAIQAGEEIDKETGLPHSYAIGANALFYLSHYLKRTDDKS